MIFAKGNSLFMNLNLFKSKAFLSFNYLFDMKEA